MEKLVYSFNEGSKNMSALLGHRGTNLAEMVGLGIPVPFGFTISTGAAKADREEVAKSIHSYISELEEVTGKEFGSKANPLLVSVRCGLGISMPGTIESLLNVGSKDDPWQELGDAIDEILNSWDKPEAFFRNLGQDRIGNSIIIQEMVYGDKGDNSFAAVVHTRNPIDGVNQISGEFKVNSSLDELAKAKDAMDINTLDEFFPEAKTKIFRIAKVLEDYYKDVQTIHFICQEGNIYVLKSDKCKRQPKGMIKTLYDMTQEGLITKRDAVMGARADHVKKLIEDDEITEELKSILKWADEFKSMKVRANIDDAKDARLAVELGAQGVGLLRTEHMFKEDSKLTAIQRLILTEGDIKREETLTEILAFHQRDIKEVYEVMEDRPVSIRLLDLPFEGILPNKEEEIAELAAQVHIGYDKLTSTLNKLRESNPMMGNRGCRLGIMYPQIFQMQTEAIALAAIQVKKEKGFDIVPEILIPMVGAEKELDFACDIVKKTMEEVIAKSEVELKYQVGTMIEIPRACLIADKLAQKVEYFSIGTNDLTQMTYGFGYTDTDNLMKDYIKKGVFEENPFKTLDIEGVGHLIKEAVSKGRETKKNLKIAACGKHSADVKSIEFFHKMGLGYISCDPNSLPVARLAAAQAVIKEK